MKKTEIYTKNNNYLRNNLLNFVNKNCKTCN